MPHLRQQNSAAGLRNYFHILDLDGGSALMHPPCHNSNVTRNVKEGESKFAAPKIVLFCAKGQTALLRIAGQYYRAYNFHAVPKASDSKTTSANDLQLRFDSTLQPSTNAFPLKPDVYSHKIAGLSAFPDGHVVDIVAMPHFLHMEGPSPVMVAAKMLTGTSETVWVSCISLATLVNISCFWLC